MVDVSLGDKDLARVMAYLTLERFIFILTLLITGLIVTYNVIKKLITSREIKHRNFIKPTIKMTARARKPQKSEPSNVDNEHPTMSE